MLEMYKYILGKVSFDKDIFRKELKKAMRSLQAEDAKKLLKWCSSSFDTQLMSEVEKMNLEKI